MTPDHTHGLCFECGNAAEYKHHVVPRSMGGTQTVPLCGLCHSKVHDAELMSTRELTRQALSRRRKAGKRIGQVPYGYDLATDGETLIENHAQQEVLQTIRILRSEEGHTLQAICNWLNCRAIPTAKGLKRWEPTTVARMTRDITMDQVRRAKHRRQGRLIFGDDE